MKLLSVDWLVLLCSVAGWDSVLETVDDAGVSGRAKELDIDILVELTDAPVPKLDEVAATLELALAEVGPTATVEEGKKLKDGMVLLSIKVNDRDIEVEDMGAVGAEAPLVVDTTAVDDDAEEVSEYENVINFWDKDGVDCVSSADDEDVSLAKDVVDGVAMLLVFANLYTFDAPAVSRHRNL